MKKLAFVATALAVALSSFAASAANRSTNPTVKPAASAKLKPAQPAATNLAEAFRQWRANGASKATDGDARKQKTTKRNAPNRKAAMDVARKQKAPEGAKRRDARKRKAGISAETKATRITKQTVIKSKSSTGYPAAKRMRVTFDPKSKSPAGLAALTPSNPAAAPKDASAYQAIVSKYASSYGVPATLAHAVIAVESNYRVDARGSAGEIGLMQIKPATARMMGYTGSVQGLFDPETNIQYGMKYLALAHKLGGGATCGTILRYNAGHAATRMNPVSSAYCAKVQRHLGA